MFCAVCHRGIGPGDEIQRDTAVRVTVFAQSVLAVDGHLLMTAHYFGEPALSPEFMRRTKV